MKLAFIEQSWGDLSLVKTNFLCHLLLKLKLMVINHNVTDLDLLTADNALERYVPFLLLGKDSSQLIHCHVL